ncbi:hypothetical protein H0N96_02560 [Candidatus Micrarchaeota archaeon]|nr:hypothetical protein [Candidatus Micrarchaeota archaeon]
MRILIPLSAQKSILNLALRKAGSERKLERELSIPSSSIYDYSRGKRLLSHERFNALLKFIGGSADYYEKQAVLLPDNWGQVKGGKACVEKKIENGVLLNQLKEARKKSNNLKDWHQQLKNENYEKYIALQHHRFRISGLDKFSTRRGEKVRNSLEKQIADFMFDNKIDYDYEPYVKIEGNSYFPDFRVGNTLIECTAWRERSKAEALLKKIKVFEKQNYTVFVFVPKNLREIYKEINDYIICSLEELRFALCPGSSATL